MPRLRNITTGSVVNVTDERAAVLTESGGYQSADASTSKPAKKTAPSGKPARKRAPAKKTAKRVAVKQ